MRNIKKHLDGNVGKEDIVFVWNGKPLKDDNILADYYYNLYHFSPTNDMMIHAYSTQCMKGGCFMVSLFIFIVIVMAVVGSMCTCGLLLVVVPFLMPLLFVFPLFCL